MKTIVRFFRGLLSLPFVLLTTAALLLLTGLTAWWHVVAWLCLPFGRRVRFHVSRWLGAMPFQLGLVNLAAHAALMIWVQRGVPWVQTFGRICRGALDKLEDTAHLRGMGGFW